MTGRMRWTIRGAAVALSAVTAAANAQTFVGPTQQYAASGCASGVVDILPYPSGRQITGTLVCAQGNSILGYTQLSDLNLLTLKLNLVYTPGPAVSPKAVIYNDGVRALLQYTGAGCTTGPVCSLEARGSSEVSMLQFFPPVPSVGAVDFATVTFTQVQLYFDYDVPSFPDFGSSSATLDLHLAAVPEPSTLVLMAGGFASLAMLVRRRTRVTV